MGEVTEALVSGLRDFGFSVFHPPGSTLVCVKLPKTISPKGIYERLVQAGYLIDWEWTVFRSQESRTVRFLISRFHTRHHVSGVLEIFAGIARALRD
jgi:DNA-binding transcriptional MocR family regulator